MSFSLASAYTEMNAISKGVSLGIFDKDKGKGIEITKNESQPYVDLMGRRYVWSHFIDFFPDRCTGVNLPLYFYKIHRVDIPFLSVTRM